mgnify:CR=1 FL=1
MALAGAGLLIYPTAIGFDLEDTAEEQQRQRDAWITIQRSHAIANGLPVVAVNRSGFEADPSGATSGAQFWGSSFVAAAREKSWPRRPPRRMRFCVFHWILNAPSRYGASGLSCATDASTLTLT